MTETVQATRAKERNRYNAIRWAQGRSQSTGKGIEHALSYIDELLLIYDESKTLAEFSGDAIDLEDIQNKLMDCQKQLSRLHVNQVDIDLLLFQTSSTLPA